ncbi:hypothetical protein BAUCODRAFT_28822 [Baudoinia panamericana UAMH 10762]|uniref:Uncharacterized protein n=1 Tax=Baudoinia panamericana (strain UAMH 10762) TaxID=717646 RepID=M2N8J4_BAUPA|nr:uncharacterized protein BAUCODRAFT_28822 [Baudoinia panamericana UAMH 10762]EMD00464.1 hypothetical protein BAUCODRAFT_28822 [Baudoinia panamericana UAMH 10762]
MPATSGEEQHIDDIMPAAVYSSPPIASPFLLRVSDVEALGQSQGFNILQQHLAQQYTFELCESHTPAESEDPDEWLIIRDVLHALLVPIVELFDKACSVAAQVTRASKLEDLEYAFTEQARSAFVWLQCFLSSEREREWCYTRGCPACVVDHSLDSEFTVRLLYAACLLSDVHYPFTLDGPTLPSFIFFLESLERALEQDPLYNDDFYELMQPKAVATRNGIEDLIRQCMDLDRVSSQPSSPLTSDSESEAVLSPLLAAMGDSSDTPRLKVKRSKMARRLMRLKKEEEQWKNEMLRRMVEERRMGDAAKDEPTVSVSEVRPDQ